MHCSSASLAAQHAGLMQMALTTACRRRFKKRCAASVYDNELHEMRATREENIKLCELGTDVNGLAACEVICSSTHVMHCMYLLRPSLSARPPQSEQVRSYLHSIQSMQRFAMCLGNACAPLRSPLPVSAAVTGCIHSDLAPFGVQSTHWLHNGEDCLHARQPLL